MPEHAETTVTKRSPFRVSVGGIALLFYVLLYTAALVSLNQGQPMVPPTLLFAFLDHGFALGAVIVAICALDFLLFGTVRRAVYMTVAIVLLLAPSSGEFSRLLHGDGDGESEVRPMARTE